MLRSANFTVWLVDLGLMSAAETALKLEASAPSIAVAIRPRRPVVAIKVFMVVSRMVDKGRSGCSTGCGQCEAVSASYLRGHANRISCLTDEDTVRGSNPTSGVEIPRRRHSNDDPRSTSNLISLTKQGVDWIERNESMLTPASVWPAVCTATRDLLAHAASMEGFVVSSAMQTR